MGLDIPGYKILRTLGRGGMATVYLAQQEIFERQVALKVMSKALAADETFGKRFFREAKIVSQLVHPNIVTVHDVGVHQDSYYLSMEFIDGFDLKQIRKTLTLRQKLQVVVDIAKALDYAGKKGYVHRDIKPENIMFHNADGRAVLTDFGIAKAAGTDTAMTQTGTAIGTPHYMSPEQAKGKPVDHRSDIYSLGVVFFLLLTGRVPFDAESAVAIGIKHITEPVPLLPDGLEALQPLLDTLLAKKPEDRYQHAGDLVDDIGLVNIDLLEQSIGYARRQMSEQANSDSPTLVNRALSAADIAVHYENDDTIINESTSLMSWFVGSLIIISLVGWLVYYQKPEWITPWLEKGKVIVEQTLESVEDKPIRAVPEDPPKKSGALESEAPKRPQAATIDQTKDRVIVRAPVKKKAVSSSGAVKISEKTYTQKLLKLQGAYTKDRAMLADLVELNRAFLRDYPQNAHAAKLFSALKAEQWQAVQSMVEQKKFDLAEIKIKQLRTLFPEVGNKELEGMYTQISRGKALRTKLLVARQYLQEKRFTSPSGSNAAAAFQQVIALDAGNAEALAGLERALAGTLAAAQRDFDRKRYSRAKNKAKRVLSINPRHQAALKLSSRAQSALDKRARVKRWLSLAAERQAAHSYYLPENDSAHYYYQQVELEDPGNAQASEGQARVLESFIQNIWSLVGSEAFVDADNQMKAALRTLPDNQRLQSLSVAVNEVLSDRMPR